MAELLASKEEQLAKEQEVREKAAAETLKREQMSVALILSQEIEARSTNIVEKCDSSKLSDFDDFGSAAKIYLALIGKFGRYILSSQSSLKFHQFTVMKPTL